MTVQALIVFAYDLQPFEIDGPGWITSDRFNIAATVPAAPAGSDQTDQAARRRGLIRALLADRFNLVAHEERREMPVFELVLARPDRRVGARMRPFEGESADPSKSGPPPESPAAARPSSDPAKGPQYCLLITGIGQISARASRCQT